MNKVACPGSHPRETDRLWLGDGAGLRTDGSVVVWCARASITSFTEVDVIVVYML
jgi:hypothetical protein